MLEDEVVYELDVLLVLYEEVDEDEDELEVVLHFSVEVIFSVEVHFSVDVPVDFSVVVYFSVMVSLLGDAVTVYFSVVVTV